MAARPPETPDALLPPRPVRTGNIWARRDSNVRERGNSVMEECYPVSIGLPDAAQASSPPTSGRTRL
jgi:hypothetical protein